MATRPLHDELLLASVGVAVNDQLELLLQPTLHRLAAMAALPQGWDSYEADPPSPAAIASARSLFLHVVEQFGALAGDRVTPFAIAPFDGGIQIEWREAQAEVEIDVDADGGVSYLFVDKGLAERRFEEGELAGWHAAIERIAQVLFPPSSR